MRQIVISELIQEGKVGFQMLVQGLHQFEVMGLLDYFQVKTRVNLLNDAKTAEKAMAKKVEDDLFVYDGRTERSTCKKCGRVSPKYGDGAIEWEARHRTLHDRPSRKVIVKKPRKKRSKRNANA